MSFAFNSNEEGHFHLGAVPGMQQSSNTAVITGSPNVGQPHSPTNNDSALPDDVVRFMSSFDLERENILLFSDSQLEKLVNVFERDETKSILLLNRLTKFRQDSKFPASAIKESVSVASKSSNFGTVLFPDSRNSKPRDVNKWPLVLGRTFRGTSDSVSVSKFLTLLISYGIKESANSIEFFRYVLFNLTPEINVEIVNYLLNKEVMEDSNSSLRLSHVYSYLKSKYSITDNPNILFARIEQMKQGSRPISDFAAEFRTRIDELKTAQGSAPISEAYVLSIFKRSQRR
jgi:hypothetical protein